MEFTPYVVVELAVLCRENDEVALQVQNADTVNQLIKTFEEEKAREEEEEDN